MIAVVIQQRLNNSFWAPVRVIAFASYAEAQSWATTQFCEGTTCFQYIEIEENTGLDPIVSNVISRFRSRSEVGQQKYQTTLERQDLDPLDWLQHLQDELMDAINYLEVLKGKLIPPD